MGADIHGVLEEGYFMTEQKEWNWSCVAELYINRNYQLFGLIAGVRGDGGEFGKREPKGFPKDASYNACAKYLMYVTPEADGQESHCTKEQAEGWVAKGLSEWWEPMGNLQRIAHPDYHSATWLTTEEVRTIAKQADLLGAHSRKFHGLAAWMTVCESKTCKMRVILWFDN